MKTRKEKLPELFTRAAFQPRSINEENRTVDVIASTGARVKRIGFFEDFYEELQITPRSVDLKRYKSGAPVLLDHRAGISSQVAVIEDARVEDGKLFTTIRFSKRADADEVFQDVKDGIVRNVSIGYRVDKFVKLEVDDERNDTDLPIYRATRIEPMELSLVSIPADAGAQVRSNDSAELYDCVIELNERENEMKKDISKENAPIEAPEKVDVDAIRKETEDKLKKENEAAVEAARKESVEVERSRVAKITEQCEKAGVAEYARELINEGVSVEDAGNKIIDKVAEMRNEKPISTVQVGDNIEVDSMREGMVNAMLNRYDARKTELTDNGRRFRQMSLYDMVAHCVRQSGTDTTMLPKAEVIRLGLHGTSDFPLITEDLANKTLRMAYMESPQSFQPLTRMREVSDFKEISAVQLSEFPALKKKNEHGEVEYGVLSESAEKYVLDEYQVGVRVTRRLIINDDLNAFASVPERAGRQARNLESDLVWAIINSNPTMADGNALFSVAHGNLAAAPGVIDVASMGAGRAAIRTQTGLDGVTKLGLVARYMAVPAALETRMDQFLAQITPDQAGNVNPFGPNGRSSLSGIVEPRLDDNSATAWYMFSDVGQVDIMEMAKLSGETEPVLSQERDFETDGLKIKIRHTCAAKAIDWRGAYKNAGV